jgi:hypothetical protein
LSGRAQFGLVGVATGIARVQGVYKMSSLGGGVSSSFRKRKKLPRALRMDKSPQGTQVSTMPLKNPLHVMEKVSLPKLIQELGEVTPFGSSKPCGSKLCYPYVICYESFKIS